MEDLSDVFGGGYNSGYHQTHMKIDMEDGKSWIHYGLNFLIEGHFSHQFRRVLKDAFSHQNICTMRKKKATLHGRWKVYTGEYNGGGSQNGKLCFIVKRLSMMMSENCYDLEVYLAKNTEERVCKVSVRDDICEITAGPVLLAKAEMRGRVMEVWIEGYMDHAFIVSLLVIVDEIKHSKLWKVVEGVNNAAIITGKVALTTAVMVGTNLLGLS